jgi:hypothetical protein
MRDCLQTRIIDNRRVKRSLLSLAVAVFCLGFTVSGFSQSLADTARRERERQKAARSKVVITSTGSTASSSAGTASKTATAPSEPAAPKPVQVVDNKGRDEKYWRATFEAARADVKTAEAKVQVLDLRLKDLNNQLLQNSEVYNREYRLAPQITATQKELEDARKESEMAKKKITDLEEELRRSGGLPGWSR